MKHFKVILSCLFSTLILYNTISVSITYIYYNIDTEGFIKQFCKNIDKPVLQCNGKCHLKKISKKESQNDKETNRGIDFKDLLLINQKLLSVNFNASFFQDKNSFFYNNLYRFKLLERCFHPPSV